MPSWNIHIAQTEALLARNGTVAATVRDRNAFLFGNVVPDILVGYMVPGIEHPIPYHTTHFATPEPIPKPREEEFWESYVAPLVAKARREGGVDPLAPLVTDAPQPDAHRTPAPQPDDPLFVPALSIQRERAIVSRAHYPERYAGEDPAQAPHLADASIAPTDAQLARSILDMALGAWAHLLADKIWNTRVNAYLTALGGTPSEEFRIKKQGDFDVFGRTLAVDLVPQATQRLLRAAERFPQYEIPQLYALETVGVMHEIVRESSVEHDHPPYRLLTDEFFAETLALVLDETDRLLAERL